MHDRYVGKWWLPGEETRQVAGELRLDADGPARLELHERLTRDPASLQELGIVLGTSLQGEALTLDRVLSLGVSSVSSRKIGGVLEREVLSPQIVYVGAHLSGVGSRQFNTAVVDFIDLMTWAGPTGLQDELGRSLEEVVVRLKLPEKRTVAVPGAEISISHGWSMTGDGDRSRGIETSVGFVINANESRELDSWLDDFVGPLRHLLTFTADRANEVTELLLKDRDADPRDGSEVEVWYPREPLAREPEGRGFEFLIDADGLGDKLAPFVASWFALCKATGTVMDAMLGPQYRPRTFVDNHFLNIAAAAEGYHRVKYRNKILSTSEHKRLVDRIVESVPEGDRKWLKERLAFSNEPTFRTRLEELHARAGGVVSGVVGDAGQFAEPIVNARNKLTHRGKGSPTGDVSGVEMFRLTQSMRFVLTACLLLDLGLDEMEVVAATRRSKAFKLLTELDLRARYRGSAGGAGA